MVESQDLILAYYSNYESHARMLADQVRTLTYREAIKEGRKTDFEAKVIVDVGAGSGILSIFAAKEGHAAKVYALEPSKIYDALKRIVK